MKTKMKTNRKKDKEDREGDMRMKTKKEIKKKRNEEKK